MAREIAVTTRIMICVGEMEAPATSMEALGSSVG
jgi:hypothetical protein